MTHRYPEHFRTTLAWVAVAHGIFLLILLLWSLMQPKPKPMPPFVSLLKFGDLVKGTPGPSEGPVVGRQFQPPAPAPPKAATKPAPVKAVDPVPEPVTPQHADPQPPEPAPAPEAVTPPAPAPRTVDPNSWSPDKVKPQKSEAAKPAANTKPKPNKPKVNVDLTPATRQSGSPTTTTAEKSHKPRNSHIADVDGTDEEGTGKSRDGVKGMTAAGVAEKLGKELKLSGVSNAVAIGPSGSPNGTNGEFSSYYTLIRDQMYQAWDMPTELVGKKLRTLIRILVEKNGTISNVVVVQSSGNSEHDRSALAAVRRVGRIREPLPDGMDGNIEINFRLTE